MKVGDGDDTELLISLAGEGELPSEQVEGECLKGDLRDLLGQLPELQERSCGCGTGWTAKTR